MRRVLYATSNPGKLYEVGRYLSLNGITLVSPAEVGGEIEVPETGSTLEENAQLKAAAYLERYPDLIIMADDTGVEIDALDGEPGIFVRRWKDHVHDMTDQEIIAYCQERMKDIPAGQRGAQFRTVIAIATAESGVKLFDGVLRGRIVEQPTPLKIKGFPFETLFYADEYQMLLQAMHELPDEQKRVMLTHRERAVAKALEYLRSLAV